MLQLVYISSATKKDEDHSAAILATSRSNNARAGVTGLLYTDGVRFLQALEGERDAVEETFARIKDDPRHRAVVVLSSREIVNREFGPWSMASRNDGWDEGEFAAKVAALLAGASPAIRGTFEGFLKVRRAA